MVYDIIDARFISASGNEGVNYTLMSLTLCLLGFYLRSYVNASGPGFAMHSSIVMPYLNHFGTPEQVEKYIVPMTAGKIIGAIGMTEPGAGR